MTKLNNKLLLKILKMKQIDFAFNEQSKKAIQLANKAGLKPEKALFYIAEEQKKSIKN